MLVHRLKQKDRISLYFQCRSKTQKNSTEKRVEFAALGKEIGLLPEDDRNNLLSEKIISFKLKDLIDHAKCGHCWLLKQSCLCSAEKEKIHTDMEHEFLFYMHAKEFGRGSNTAVVVIDTFPRNSKIFIAGIKKDEGQLQRIIEEQKGNIFVLTPSPQSVFLSEIKANRDLVVPSQKFTFIVLDGTWDQTKRLARNEVLKDIPHLKLDCAGNTMSTLRKQSNYGRVTTAEAVMLLLDELGFQKEVAFLHQRLELKIFRAQLQRGRIDSTLFPIQVTKE
jgi:DTW domain-containing protein YfiP